MSTKQIDNEIFSLSLEDKGLRFDNETSQLMCGPGVYAFMLGDLPLYIGMSGNALSRSASKHHRMKDKARAECDNVRVWFCKSVRKARRLESLLIARIKPKYNVRNRLASASHTLGLQRASNVYPQFREGTRRKRAIMQPSMFP